MKEKNKSLDKMMLEYTTLNNLNLIIKDFNTFLNKEDINMKDAFYNLSENHFRLIALMKAYFDKKLEITKQDIIRENKIYIQ